MKRKLSAYLATVPALTVLSSLILAMFLLISNYFLSVFLSVMNYLEEGVKHNKPGSFPVDQIFGLENFLNFQFHDYYYYYYLAVLVVTAIVIVMFCYDMRKNFADLNIGQYGTNRFARLHELKKQYQAVPEKKDSFDGYGGAIISHYGHYHLIDTRPVNNLIIGATRSGKTETIVAPMIDVYSRAKKKASLIINDPKGELAAASFVTLKKRGYDVFVLNLLKPDQSMSYNPLQLVKEAYIRGDYSEAVQLTRTMAFQLYNDPTAKDKHWQNSAMSLFSAIVLAIVEDSFKKNKEEQVNLYSVAQFLSEKGSAEDADGNNELDVFFQRRPAMDIAKLQYSTSKFSQGSERGSIFSSTMEKLQTFIDEGIARLTAKNSFDLKSAGFGDKPVAVFMVVPDYDSSNDVIASIFVSQLYKVSAKEATLTNGSCPRQIVFLLDEFGNMPAIDDMGKKITVCLSRNIRFNLVIQAYSQLDSLYGKTIKDTILANCGNTLYIQTTDEQTASHFSKLIGSKTIIDVSRTGNLVNKTLNENAKDRPLMNANELMRIGVQESVVFRPMTRQDNRLKKIQSYPIYNHGRTALKARWQLLNDEFNTKNSLQDLPINCEHKHLDLRDIVFGSVSDKDLYSKISITLGKNDFLLVSNLLEDQLNVESVQLFRSQKNQMTLIQLMSFLKHVIEQLTFDDVKTLERTLKPYFSTKEWSKWQYIFINEVAETMFRGEKDEGLTI